MIGTESATAVVTLDCAGLLQWGRALIGTERVAKPNDVLVR